MSNKIELNSDLLNWLLDASSPDVRYLTLRDLLDYPEDHDDLRQAREDAYQSGAIATVLNFMAEDGYWFKPGAGYSPKYKSTAWSIILLAQLGASVKHDPRLALACEYLLDHSLTKHGQFTMQGTPSSTIDCLQGNLCAALLDLGVEDPRLSQSFEWMARSITGEGIAPATNKEARLRYYPSGNSGPRFACGWNNNQACAWGAIKTMLAFSKLPLDQRTSLINQAIQIGAEFLLSRNPALADYPTKDDSKPSGKWWKLGFPVFYVTDVLQNIEALIALGYGADARLSDALDLIRAKQDNKGRWPIENTYTTWVDFGPLKHPNKWVTLRVLRTLREVA